MPATLTVLIMLVLLGMLAIELAVHRQTRLINLERRYYSNHQERVVLTVWEHELAYKQTNTAGYRAFVLCLGRLHVCICSYIVGPAEDESGIMQNQKLWFGFNLCKGHLCDLDTEYSILHMAVGANTAYAFALDWCQSTKWQDEDLLTHRAALYDNPPEETEEPEEEEEEEEESTEQPTETSTTTAHTEAIASLIATLCFGVILFIVLWCMHNTIH